MTSTDPLTGSEFDIIAVGRTIPQTHPPSRCAGEVCPIHNQSDHHGDAEVTGERPCCAEGHAVSVRLVSAPPAPRCDECGGGAGHHEPGCSTVPAPDPMHIGRAFAGTEIEDADPHGCVQAPCGLVDSSRTDPACTQHRGDKTMRQMHRASACPARGGDDRG